MSFKPGPTQDSACSPSPHFLALRRNGLEMGQTPQDTCRGPRPHIWHGTSDLLSIAVNIRRATELVCSGSETRLVECLVPERLQKRHQGGGRLENRAPLSGPPGSGGKWEATCEWWKPAAAVWCGASAMTTRPGCTRGATAEAAAKVRTLRTLQLTGAALGLCPGVPSLPPGFPARHQGCCLSTNIWLTAADRGPSPLVALPRGQFQDRAADQRS
jgi:hypothetical protein